MQHLSHSSEGTNPSLKVLWMSRPGSSRCIELNHMLHRLCGPPSIHLSFNLAAVLPGGRLNALAPEATPQGHNLQVDIVYGVDYQGI